MHLEIHHPRLKSKGRGQLSITFTLRQHFFYLLDYLFFSEKQKKNKDGHFSQPWYFSPQKLKITMVILEL
jgi:hypothetical protein